MKESKTVSNPVSYVPGLLSSLLSGTVGEKNVSSSSGINNALSDIFSKAPQNLIKNDNKKILIENGSANASSLTGAARRIAAKAAKKTIKEDSKKKKKDEPKPKDPERLARTIFVGGVPLNCKEASVRNFLGIEKSKVEAVYFRSVPVARKWINQKRTGAIRKEFEERADQTKNAYVVLKEQDETLLKETLKKNGEEYEGLKIRVDREGTKQFSKFDRKKSVFVGKLSIKVSEKELLSMGQEVGEVIAARIVKDPKTSISKCFGFIMFTDRTSVPKAVQKLHGRVLFDKKIVVTKCLKEDDAKEKTKQMNLKKKSNKRLPADLHRFMTKKVRKLQKRAENRQAKAAAREKKQKQAAE